MRGGVQGMALGAWLNSVKSALQRPLADSLPCLRLAARHDPVPRDIIDPGVAGGLVSQPGANPPCA
jgi:hypothetical protein